MLHCEKPASNRIRLYTPTVGEYIPYVLRDLNLGPGLTQEKLQQFSTHPLG